MAYNAFISYSHAADGQLAPALQSALHRFAKPWYQLRALRVFRDTSSLSVSPHLWPSIERALSQSDYFLFMASPASAESPWVQRELSYWMEHRSLDRLLVVQTDGHMEWNDELGDFDWDKTTSLPESLQGAFNEEPLYLDMRWARGSTDLSLANPRFRDAIAAIAATLHDRPKDELIGADVQQHRRTRTLVRAVAAGLVTLTLASATGAYFALQQKYRADRQREIAEKARITAEAKTQIAVGRLLGAQAAQFLNQDDSLLVRATLLAVESLKRAPSSNAGNTLRAALSRLSVNRSRIAFESRGAQSAGSRDGKYKVVVDAPFDYSPFPLNGWEADVFEDGELIAALQAGKCTDESGRFDVQWSWAGRVARFVEKKTGYNGLVMHDGVITSCGISRDGSRIITASGDVHRELPPVPIPGDSTVQVWEMPPSLFDLSQDKKDNRDALLATAFSPDGRYLAVSLYGQRDNIRIFKLATGREITRFEAIDRTITDLAFSADSRYLASAPVYGDFFQVWSVDDFKEIARLKQYSSEGSVAFSPDTRFLITDYGELTHPTGTDIWDLATQKRMTAFGANPRNRAAMIFSPNGEKLITIEDKLLVWDPRTREQQLAIETKRAQRWTLHPTESLIALVTDTESVQLFSLEDGEAGETIAEARGRIACVSFSPDGRYLAVCYEDDHSVRLWELAGAEEPLVLGHEDTVIAVAFSKDGEYIATAVYTYGGREVNAYRVANVVKIWKVVNGDLIATLYHHGLVSDLEFSPDGRYLRTQTYVSEESGFAPSYVWLWHPEDLIEAACQSLPRNMTLEEWRTFMPGEPYRQTCGRLPSHPSAYEVTLSQSSS